MLTLLRISGFALIDELELPLGPGLTVVTGETGAGKSILVEALSLLRGRRAAADLIRTGADEARVEALIELPPDDAETREALAAAGRSFDEGLVVRRTIARNGRGRVHLGGGIATAADLAATVGRVIDIASQHDQQSLTDPASQLAILDAFADNRTLLAEMDRAHRGLTEAVSALASFDADARARAERQDLLRFQLAEIEGTRIQAGEDDALRAERERLRGAEKLEAAAGRGEDVLYAGEGAVAGTMAGVARELGALTAVDPALAPMVERLREAHVLVEDVARDLGRYREGIRSDPARLSELEDRLFLLGRLCRKHGGSLNDVLARAEAMQRELAEIESADDAIAARRAARDSARVRAAACAATLLGTRRRAAAALGKKVDQTLHELALTDARLVVEVERADGDDPGRRGHDRVRFLFAPNLGEEPRPLARIASGGELSRVMLAVKQALARTDQVRTYVFDEVDAGVGGGAADTIGRKLRHIAGERQVIAITHLPQIAAYADHHWHVTKSPRKGRTVVVVNQLSAEERAVEIARMLGGASPSKEAKAHAEHMLRRRGS